MKTSKLSLRQELFAVVGIGGVVFLLLGWWLLISPVQSRIGELQLFLEQGKTRKILIEQIQSAEIQYQANELFAMEATDRHSLLEKITGLTKKHRLSVVSMEPFEEEKPYFSRFVLELNTKSGFSALLHFLSNVENMQPPLIVTRLTLGQNMRGTYAEKMQSQIQAQMTLEGLMKREN